MRLEGIHHVTAITGDAPRNLDFYARVLGLRFVKKTVNFDAPEVYHLYYGDELGTPGSVLTFFEFPGAAAGVAGAGMVHRITWRVASPEALEFWEARLTAEGVAAERAGDYLRFRDPEGLGLELAAVEVADPPLAARAEGVPPDCALLGFHGVRAHASAPERSDALLSEGLGLEPSEGGGYVTQGEERRSVYAYDPPPEGRAVQGAGTVHHVAWASQDEDHAAWRERVARAGAQVTPIIDRTYFRSIYFREPSGVLFEIATLSPGFTVDEPAERLGEELRLPERYERLRPQLERTLTPLRNPRAGAPGRAGKAARTGASDAAGAPDQVDTADRAGATEG